ncbi:slc36a4 [Symbiodinium sp. CCMP2592]|nr:slc36a4 [Symbiodinium sp. CCMP2592]
MSMLVVIVMVAAVPMAAALMALDVAFLVRSGLGAARRISLAPEVVLAAFGIIVSQLGFCVAYVDIIITTLLEPNLLADKIPESVLRVGLAVVLCLLSSLRKLDSLAKISVLALAVYAYLLVVLPIRWGTEELTSGRAPSLRGVWGKFEPSNLGLWLGTSIFAQEAVVVSQCVYQDMRLRDHRAFRPILVSSFVICSVASTALAAFGCMCYGDSVKQVFYLNFPASSLDVTIAETILCLVLLPTFVIQLYPVARCFDELLTCAGYVSLSSDDSDETLEDSEEGRGQSCLVKVLARWLLVIISCVVAAVVPDLACISGYSGSFAMSVIGFFLPPLCHLKLHHFRVSTLDWILNVGLLAVGVTALVLGVSNTHCGAE